jgi:hypothetical protein
MWLKGILNAAEMLWEDYLPNYRGFNQFLLDGIGVAPEPLFSYLETLPTYPDTEQWVREHATNLNADSIAEFNTFVHTFERPEEAAAGTRERVGLENSTLRISSELINLDDWCTMHDYLVRHRNAAHEQMYPTVSSGVAGPIGIAHIPRFWIKALLAGVGALPPVRSGRFGFDRIVANIIGMDHDAAVAFIRTELPSYVQFEAWLQDNLPASDDAARAAWNETIRAYQKPAELAAEDRSEAGVPELSFREFVLLNDMVDWKHQRDRVIARHVVRS